MSQFFTNEQSTTNTMSCPSCRQIIMASATSCRYCGVPIDAHTAAVANAAQQRLNSAIGQANAIKLSGLAAVIAAVGMALFAFDYVGDRRLFVVWFGPPVAIASILNWFRQFGSVQTTDPDYAAAKRDVGRAGLIWAAALVVEVALLFWILLR